MFPWLFYKSWSIPTTLAQVNRQESLESFHCSLIFSFLLPHYNARILLRYSVFYFKVILCKEGLGVLLFHLNILLALCRSWCVCINYHNSPTSFVTSQCKHSTQDRSTNYLDSFWRLKKKCLCETNVLENVHVNVF